MSIHEVSKLTGTTTTKRGSQGENRKVGAKLISLGDRIIRKAESMFEIPKNTLGKLVYQVLTGAKPVGRGEWARVSVEEIDREQLGQVIAALSAIYYAMDTSGAGNPVEKRLTALGFDEKFARLCAADSFYSVDYIDAHWRDIQGDPNVSNPKGCLRSRLARRTPIAKKQTNYEGW